MRTSFSWLRRILVLTLLLQPAGGALVRLAHMPQEARGLGHSEHLQAPGAAACVPHSHDSCRLCRTSHLAPLAVVACERLPVEAQLRPLALAAVLTILPSREPVHPLGSRAPPRV